MCCERPEVSPHCFHVSFLLDKPTISTCVARTAYDPDLYESSETCNADFFLAFLTRLQMQLNNNGTTERMPRTQIFICASTILEEWLNIACAGSEAMDGRIFMKRDWRSCRPCRMPHSLSRLSQIQSKGMDKDTNAYLSSEFHLYSIFAGFLNRRGWILQERLLSPRTIYYGKDEIYWECNHMIASETVPWGWTNDSLMAKINSYSDPPKRKSDTISAKTLEHTGQGLSNPEAKFKRLNIAVQQTDLAPLYEYWYKIIEGYSQKKLTVAA
ncbi:hypothetical protein OIDMADRAFT_23704 [Oidiodendron maius Zn]|uniref:Uncharacterized protein n=1 Tax=Oidiodendron maius (strain Zn) TaxID=913774 RepID=A0A0C3E3M3_OIDMZ|nr:hypothetical protein OIDMADRAFT_23704 [Oidiodendron maius Zn]